MVHHLANRSGLQDFLTISFMTFCSSRSFSSAPSDTKTVLSSSKSIVPSPGCTRTAPAMRYRLHHSANRLGTQDFLTISVELLENRSDLFFDFR